MSNRIAIVTGAARGLGAAIAIRLAADGLAVAALDLDAAACREVVEAITTAKGQAIAVSVDVTDAESVSMAVDEVTARLGAPTVLVNNAGILRDNLLFKMTEADWDAVMEVHLRGTFLMSRATQSHMVAAGWGRIVNLSSTSALGNRGQANYSAAKAGIQGFTKAVAVELGKFGITVNSISPGIIDTEMARETAARQGLAYEEYARQRAATIPIGRMGTADDVAAVASFFVREDAGYVSGQVMYVAGGPKA